MKSSKVVLWNNAQNIEELFCCEHKAITWSWLEDDDHRDVSIAVRTLDFRD